MKCVIDGHSMDGMNLILVKMNHCGKNTFPRLRFLSFLLLGFNTLSVILLSLAFVYMKVL